MLRQHGGDPINLQFLTAAVIHLTLQMNKNAKHISPALLKDILLP